MTELPVLKDWKTLIENRLKRTAHAEKDILAIIHMCRDFAVEIQPASLWLAQQHAFIAQIDRIFTDMFFTRFGEQPPPRPKEAINEVVLNTLEVRRKAVREVALSLATPGGDVSDEAVLEELKRRGMKIEGYNPNATIATILRGFRPQFEKVQGKRGIFRRRQ